MVSQALLDKLKANKNKFSRSAGRAFKFPEGRTKFRILPNPEYMKDDTLPFYQQLAVHWIKASEDQKPIAVVGDVEYTFEETANYTGERVSGITPLISQAVAAAKAAGDEEGLRLYKSWYARKSVLVNAVLRLDDRSKEEVRIIEMGPSLFSDIITSVQLHAEEGINALDLDKGIDYVVERVGKGLDTTYTVMTAPVSKPVNKALLEKTFDLLAFVQKEHFRSGEEVKAIAAIEKFSGVSAKTALVAPRGTALLTSAAASLAPEPKQIEAKAEVKTRPPVEAKVKAPVEAKVKLPVETAISPPEQTIKPSSDFEDAELEAMIKELDGVTV